MLICGFVRSNFAFAITASLVLRVSMHPGYLAPRLLGFKGEIKKNLAKRGNGGQNPPHRCEVTPATRPPGHQRLVFCRNVLVSKAGPTRTTDGAPRSDDRSARHRRAAPLSAESAA